MQSITIFSQNLYKYTFLVYLAITLTSCGLFERLRKKEDDNVSGSSRKIETIIESAQSKIGTPYKFGGTTSAGYDCSGLVYTSFEEAGLKLPRTSNEQATVGREVAFEKVRPGDLVFFATKKGESKITHSGIVTDVRAKEVVIFIHAANSGVREDNIYSKYYREAFVKAMRPFDALLKK